MLSCEKDCSGVTGSNNSNDIDKNNKMCIWEEKEGTDGSNLCDEVGSTTCVSFSLFFCVLSLAANFSTSIYFSAT